MKMTILFSVLLFSSPSPASEEECPSLATAADVLTCLESRAPEVRRAQADVERARALTDGAGRWGNPELAVDSISGKVGDESVSETNVSLGFPVELGGKIGARKAVVAGELARAEAALFEARVQARAEGAVQLHRLRQLHHELEIVDEAMTTFSKLLSQYAGRFKLSPEQEVSATVFRMARSEYLLVKAGMAEEVASLEAWFKLLTGKDASELRPVLPASPRQWPSLAASASLASSAALKKSLAEAAAAQAELDVARSDAWPTPTVGPAFKRQQDGGRSGSLVGISLSFPLPVFNANGAAKAAAAASVRAADERAAFTRAREESARESRLRSYEQSVRVLGSTLSHDEMERKHADIEKLFMKGIVPSSLVIEAHRTFIDLEKTRHERELKTLESLAVLLGMEGKLMELPQ